MGAHHALATPTPTARLGRLAGRGALTASAALALAGAGSGAAMAHESDGPATFSGDHGSFADDGLLCGLLGGGDCSSGSSSGDDDSGYGHSRDAGSDDDTSSIFDHVDGGSGATYGSDRFSDSDRSGGDASDRSGSSSSGRAQQAAGTGSGATGAKPAQSPAQGLDTPPPPGQVRTIPIGG